MKILLQLDWKSKISGKVIVYLSNNKNKKFIDRTFDELHKLGSML